MPLGQDRARHLARPMPRRASWDFIALTDGTLSTVTAAGPLNPKEVADMRATDRRSGTRCRSQRRPRALADGRRAGDTPGRRRRQTASGSNWIGLRATAPIASPRWNRSRCCRLGRAAADRGVAVAGLEDGRPIERRARKSAIPVFRAQRKRALRQFGASAAHGLRRPRSSNPAAPAAHTGSSICARRLAGKIEQLARLERQAQDAGSDPPARETSPVPAAGSQIPPASNKAHRPPAGWRARGPARAASIPACIRAMPMPRPRWSPVHRQGPQQQGVMRRPPDRPEAHRAAQDVPFSTATKDRSATGAHAFAQAIGGFGEAAGTKASASVSASMRAAVFGAFPAGSPSRRFQHDAVMAFDYAREVRKGKAHQCGLGPASAASSARRRGRARRGVRRRRRPAGPRRSRALRDCGWKFTAAPSMSIERGDVGHPPDLAAVKAEQARLAARKPHFLPELPPERRFRRFATADARRPAAANPSYRSGAPEAPGPVRP